MERCLYCYKELEEGQKDFHPRCAKKIFGSAIAPVLPYTRGQIAELATEVIRSQTTLTGVQPKLSLDINKQRGEDAQRFTIVGLWGRYILKPQTDAFRSLPEVEDLTMHLAEAVKIQVVPHSLIRFADGELCYITKRIDRGAKGEKYPMEDMCQLSERLTEYKYKGSYEQIAKLIAKYSSTPKLDVVNFWEQVVFSWTTGNADMHLKNFSLYQPQKEVVTLTPGYDMLSTALVMPEDKEELGLTLNGKKRKIKLSDFQIAMRNTGLEDKIIQNIFVKFTKALDSWLQWVDISFLSQDMKERYKELLKEKISIIQKSDSMQI
ncbi:HipA domain-containing protein [Bacteroides sp.]|uniref:HipA domain-containing protein n=2 Tax=Bacteroides sp. TaxID=29523 RepID=UPI001B4D6925|nr:HipA domain-containing protein [Bacteroides sp.]MBP6936528.1 HipA domain-containing protein [Bacteroides sp.]MBP8622572.1 HipA domain-containing protein [Bacteroides sp.]MBP9508209.1 HipA domain-containing protein [Bacteroides sp.]MBP9587486.1 HipA domain-containing protein [Bacteroides sp.]